MINSLKNLKICSSGHKYYKSSNCPVCPICEQERKPESGFLSLISAPARRALENNRIKTLQDLSAFSKEAVLRLHGMGPGTIPKLEKALKQEGLSFKNDEK